MSPVINPDGVGKQRDRLMRAVTLALRTKWGRLFQSYGDGQVVMPGMEPKTVAAAAGGAGALLLALGLAALFYRRARA